MVDSNKIMSVQTISCILLFFIKLLYFPGYVTSTRPSCSPVVTAPVCPDGYVETPSPRRCVKVFYQKLNYSSAKKYCADLDPPYSSMWISYNKETTEHMKELMIPIKKKIKEHPFFYIGLTDQEKEYTWVWSNGQQLRHSTSMWDPTQPNGGRRENCAVVLIDSMWSDYPCSKELPVFCMTRHQIGPREIEMSVKSHAPNRASNIIYKGGDVTYTCSAFMQYDKDAFLTIREKNGKEYRPGPSFGAANNSLGMCTKRVTVEVTLKDLSPSRTFECYARKLDFHDQYMECNNNPGEFCKTFDIPIHIIDPPIKKPILKIDTNLVPVVTVVCKVNVGSTGKLTWVLYYKNATEELQGDDPRIHGETREVTNNTRWLEQSTLILEDYEEVKGIGVGCFDHNITKYSLNTTCDTDDLFCDRKNVPILSMKGSSLVSLYMWLLIFIIIASVFGICLIVWKNNSHKAVDENDLKPDSTKKVNDAAEQEHRADEEGQRRSVYSEENVRMSKANSISMGSQVDKLSHASNFEKSSQASKAEKASQASKAEKTSQASQAKSESMGSRVDP